jgi:hypothetical protein
MQLLLASAAQLVFLESFLCFLLFFNHLLSSAASHQKPFLLHNSILHGAAALHMQVLAGLDDVLMCLAELQLQQEGKGSCASALEKASTCMHQLQDSLSVGTSTGQHKLAVEVSKGMLATYILHASRHSLLAAECHAMYSLLQSCLTRAAC